MGVRSLLIHAVLLAAAAPVMGEPLPGFERVARTEHFDFYAQRSGRRLLKVEPEKTERLLARFARELGVTPEGRSDYFRHEYPEAVAFASGSPNSSNTGTLNPLTGTIHSTHPCHPHEIVHLVSYRLGNPGPLFVEGLAVALGDEGRLGGWRVDSLARQYLPGEVTIERVEASFHSPNPSAAYALAGSFVRHLIRRHGIARVAAFFRAVGARTGARDAEFAATFGDSLPAAWQTWRASLSARSCPTTLSPRRENRRNP
jgi:hypothetical protein